MKYPSYQDIQEVRRNLLDTTFDRWLHHDVLSWQWWLLLAAAILPWGIWGRLVDKERRVEVFAYAMLFGMLAIILDVAGVNALLWGYPTKLFPIVPPLFPADVTLFPVVYSLLYQYGRTWSSYILYAALASCICAFMIEPACIWMGMYSNDHFPHWKSCIGFLLVAVMTKAIIGSLRTEDRKAAAAESQ